jgi:phenylpyruvate tautomerase PptA (4-oxalocrotonate tautomerase family)
MENIASRRSRYSAEQRRELVKKVTELIDEGLTADRAIGQVGLSKSSYYKWSLAPKNSRRRRLPGLRPVLVTRIAEPAAQSPLTVLGPVGLRIEGLDIAGVAQLLRQLG